MSNQTLRFYFKLVYTTKTWNLDINGSMSTADFIEYINKDSMHSLFNIHQYYYIEVVSTNNNHYRDRDSEMEAPIVTSNFDSIAERFSPKTNAFYLRPVNSLTREFIRRDDYSIMPNIGESGTHETLVEPTPQGLN